MISLPKPDQDPKALEDIQKRKLQIESLLGELSEEIKTFIESKGDEAKSLFAELDDAYADFAEALKKINKDQREPITQQLKSKVGCTLLHVPSEQPVKIIEYLEFEGCYMPVFLAEFPNNERSLLSVDQFQECGPGISLPTLPSTEDEHAKYWGATIAVPLLEEFETGHFQVIEEFSGLTF